MRRLQRLSRVAPAARAPRSLPCTNCAFYQHKRAPPARLAGRGVTMPRATRLALSLAVAGLYLAHQDFWFWREARPLVFGMLPIGLAYHAMYCIAAALLMWLLTSVAWPAHLEPDQEER